MRLAAVTSETAGSDCLAKRLVLHDNVTTDDTLDHVADNTIRLAGTIVLRGFALSEHFKSATRNIVRVTSSTCTTVE